MVIGLYVLLALILVLMIVLAIFIFWKKKNQNLETQNKAPVVDNLPLIQKDIAASKEILESKIESLQNQLVENKNSITTTLNNFNQTTQKNDLDFNQNLTQLNEKLMTLKSDLNKQDTNLKIDLNGQKENINRSFSNVMNNLTILTESSKSLKEVEDKVKSLNNVFLNSNKTRGNLGEYLLEKLLSDLYGENHELWLLQQKLPDGNIVDAVLKTGTNKEDIAIDAKFPLVNYNNYIKAEEKHTRENYLKDFKRDFRTKVDEVAKYIKKENEISSAIMFIPSEDIFSFVYSEFQDEVIKYALNKKIWITSPTTLSAILFVLDKHLQESKFNQNIELIRKQLLKIETEFNRWITRWEIFTKDVKKMNKDIEELDTTHKKISSNYKAIYKNQKLELEQVKDLNQDLEIPTL